MGGGETNFSTEMNVGLGHIHPCSITTTIITIIIIITDIIIVIIIIIITIDPAHHAS